MRLSEAEGLGLARFVYYMFIWQSLAMRLMREMNRYV